MVRRMKKLIIAAVCAAVAAAGIISSVCIFAGGDRIHEKNKAFLHQYGWDVREECIEQAGITIPAEFDDVYTNYNLLQKDAGLDLTPYKGMRAVRYTYIVTNFPDETGEPIRANVVCVKGEPVAGDIMTVSLGGFMFSLNFNTTQCWLPLDGIEEG